LRDTHLANLVFCYMKVAELDDLEGVVKRYVIERIKKAPGVALVHEVTSVFRLAKSLVERNVDLLKVLLDKAIGMVEEGGWIGRPEKGLRCRS